MTKLNMTIFYTKKVENWILVEKNEIGTILILLILYFIISFTSNTFNAWALKQGGFHTFLSSKGYGRSNFTCILYIDLDADHHYFFTQIFTGFQKDYLEFVLKMTLSHVLNLKFKLSFLPR